MRVGRYEIPPHTMFNPLMCWLADVWMDNTQRVLAMCPRDDQGQLSSKDAALIRAFSARAKRQVDRVRTSPKFSENDAHEPPY